MTQENSPRHDIDIHRDVNPTVKVRRVVDKTEQDVLRITRSNVERELSDIVDRIRQSRDWVTPLAFLIPLGLATLTVNFVDRFGIDADIWSLGFLISTLVSLGWLIVELVQRYRRGKPLSAREIVDLLMTEGTSSSSVSGQHTRTPEASEANQLASPQQQSSTVESPDQGRPPEESAGQGKEQPPQPAIASDNVNKNGATPEFSDGARVWHRNFGSGTVLAISPGLPLEVQVKFDDTDVGTKRLRVAHAPLQLLGNEK